MRHKESASNNSLTLHLSLWFTRSMKRISKGFTLIELLIVIAIIGILAAGLIVLVNPLAQFQKARDAGRKSDIRAIKIALEAYYNDKGTYPSCVSGSDWVYSRQSQPWIPGLTSTYINTLPIDPINNGSPPWDPGPPALYSYAYTSTASSCGSKTNCYVIAVRLENANDPAVGKSLPSSCGGYTAGTSTAGVVYYSN